MRRRIFFIGAFIGLVITANFLTACGQKGDLYLPAPEQHASVNQNSLEQSDNRDVKKKKEDR